MSDPLRLMCVLAHPDDESLGMGGMLARYAAEGVATSVITATRGERGWDTSAPDYPGLAELGRIREAEERAACQVLGVQDVHFLGYIDGDLDQAPAPEVIDRIVAHLRRFRPQVVITFGPEGGYGHPDHMAISQFTTAACVAAADPAYRSAGDAPAHRVAKLYFMAEPVAAGQIYVQLFGDLVMTVDGVDRHPYFLPDWQISARLDCVDYWPRVWQAVQCHATQLPATSMLQQVSEATHRTLWGEQCYVRAYSLVNGGRRVETDLFEGLR